MGKQSKRKHKRRSGGAGQHHRPAGLADDPGVSDPAAAEQTSPAANVVSKLRHGDPRVRHAALVALAGTVYDGTSLSSAAKRRVNGDAKRAGGETKAEGPLTASHPPLLRSLAERLLDPDTPCATAAAGCLSNYVTFYCGAGDGAMEGEASHEVAADVMVPILLRRLHTSADTLSALGNQMAGTPATSGTKGDTAASAASTVEKLWPAFQEQFALLSLSLLTLAGLIENCPRAAERLGATAFGQLLAVLPLVHHSMDFMRKEGQSIIKEAKDVDPMVDAATHASRALHSLLDDNAQLVASLPVGTPIAASAAPSSFGTAAPPSLTSAVAELTTFITDGNVGDMARLHASGAVLSLRRAVVFEKEMSDPPCKATPEEQQVVAALQSCTNAVIVPMLHSLLTVEGDQRPDRLLFGMIDLSKKLSKIKQDAAMESQIVQEVNARKEPAREIAKRQKKLKEDAKEKQQRQEAGGMDVEGERNEESKEGPCAAMLVEDDASKESGAWQQQQQQQEEEEGKLQEELDGTVQSWRDLLGSRKLALELVTNLCSGQEEGEDDEGDVYDDDDERMWDSDDEARLAATAADDARDADAKCPPSERATYESIAVQHLPEQILLIFQKWAAFLPCHMQHEHDEPPALVKEEVEELLSTCALCLGNVAACESLPTWDAPSAKDSVVLGGNVLAVQNGLQWFWWELVSTLASENDSKAHIASVMLSLLRNQPPARTMVDSPTLDLLFGLLSSSGEDGANGSDASVQMHSHVISMLGVLCSEPHPASIDARVCAALLERLRAVTLTNNNDANDDARNAIVTTHEILNVLMDMYGADECHDEVFQKEDVLGHFQRSLPGFKRRIKRVASSAPREEVGVWNETALNASRFIKYKKEG